MDDGFIMYLRIRKFESYMLNIFNPLSLHVKLLNYHYYLV